MILGGYNDVFYFIVIVFNEYLTKTHYNVTLMSDCLHNGVRRRAWYYLKSIIPHCLSTILPGFLVINIIYQLPNIKRIGLVNLNKFLCKQGNLVTVSTMSK